VVTSRPVGRPHPEENDMPRRIAAMVLAAALAPVAGCAWFGPGSVTTGMPSADVRTRLGTPTDIRTIAGATAWDYAQGPQGFTTWRITLDAAGRVQRLEQLLTAQRLLSIEAGRHGRDDVAALVGRPGDVMRFGARGAEVWTYRYLEFAERRVADVTFDAVSGRVSAVTSYPDPAYANAQDT